MGPHVLGGEPARFLHPGGVGAREVGTDHAPAVPAVGGSVDVLAAGVDHVVVVRRNVDGEGPLEAVAHIGGRPALGVVRPHAHRAGDPGGELVPLEDALVAPRPDHVVGHRVGDGEPDLAAAYGAPRPHRNRAPGEGVGGPAGRGPVLTVAVQVVGNLGVGVHMVHLGNGQERPVPVAPPVGGNAHPLVVADDHARGVVRVDPHVVVVAPGDDLEGHAPVQRARVQRGHEVHLVGVVGRDRHARVVERTLRQRVIGVHHRPGAPPVVGPPERPLMLLQLLVLPVGVGFDERVDPVRVRRGHGEADSAHGAAGQSRALEPGPAVASVAAGPEPAFRASALAPPGPDLHLPGRGEEDARVGGIHHHVDRAGVLARKEHPLPVLPAVGGAEQPPLLLRAVEVAHRCDVHHVRVVRMDDDAPDPSRLVEPHVPPGAARVGGAVHAVADRDV